MMNKADEINDMNDNINKLKKQYNQSKNGMKELKNIYVTTCTDIMNKYKINMIQN